MRLIKNATKLIGTKDPNIIISLVFETDPHIKIHAKLDYPAPLCPYRQGRMIKYGFQRASKIPHSYWSCLKTQTDLANGKKGFCH